MWLQTRSEVNYDFVFLVSSAYQMLNLGYSPFQALLVFIKPDQVSFIWDRVDFYIWSVASFSIKNNSEHKIKLR